MNSMGDAPAASSQARAPASMPAGGVYPAAWQLLSSSNAKDQSEACLQILQLITPWLQKRTHGVDTILQLVVGAGRHEELAAQLAVVAATEDMDARYQVWALLHHVCSQPRCGQTDFVTALATLPQLGHAAVMSLSDSSWSSSSAAPEATTSGTGSSNPQQSGGSCTSSGQEGSSGSCIHHSSTSGSGGNNSSSSASGSSSSSSSSSSGGGSHGSGYAAASDQGGERQDAPDPSLAASVSQHSTTTHDPERRAELTGMILSCLATISLHTW